MNKSLNTRVVRLEAKKPALPIVVIWQAYDKPGVYYRHSERLGEPLTEDEIEMLELTSTLIKVSYKKSE